MTKKGFARFTTNFFLVLISLLLGTIAGIMISREVADEDPNLLNLRPSTGEPASLPDGHLVEEKPGGNDVRDLSSVTETNVEEISKNRENAIVKAASVVGPCVVSINVFQTQIVQTGFPFDDFWSNFFSPHRYQREVQSLGSGFIISAKGHILTNEHVVHDASRILVTLEDGRVYEAVLTGSDIKTDLALLRIDAKDLAVSPLGDSDKLILGEWVIAIGNPFGYLLDDPKPSVTVGVVSALKRDIKPERGESRVFANMIQTDASINPGNSGGPLVDSNGQVIGVNTFILTKSGGSLGMGFAVPIKRAERVVKDLVKYGKVRWPWIGIHPQELTSSLREGLEIADDKMVSGIILADIDAASPAEKAGLIRGDIITELNGRAIRSIFDWEGEITDIPVGKTMKVSILRKTEVKFLDMKTEYLPTDIAKQINSDIGIIMADLTDDIKSQIGAVSSKGAVVIDVEGKELEEDRGIIPFDLILKINNQNIESADHAAELLENIQRGSRTLLVIERDGKLIYRSLIRG
jgi:serine protease Do